MNKLELIETRITSYNVCYTKLLRAPILADIEGLLETIRVTQYIDGGETGGFQINGIAPTNVLARLGLRNGDVIRAINGESIRNNFV